MVGWEGVAEADPEVVNESLETLTGPWLGLQQDVHWQEKESIWVDIGVAKYKKDVQYVAWILICIIFIKK